MTGKPTYEELRQRVEELEKLVLEGEQTEKLLRGVNDEILLAKEEWERTFEAVPDFISIIDGQHRIVRCNRAMAERLGMSASEVSELTCYEVIHGTDAPPDFCPHSRLLEDGQEHSVEVYEKGFKGWFRITASPLNDAEGKLFGCVYVAHDITENKKAEEKVEESEKKYRTLVENFPDFIARFDEEGRHLFVNPSITKAFDMPLEQIIGKTLRELPDAGTPEQIETLTTKVKEVFEHGIPNTTQASWMTQEGERFFNIRHVPELDQHGKVISVLGVTRDVTSHKRTKEKLKEGEERFRSLFEQAANSIALVDADTGGIIEFNERAHEDLGYSREEFERLSLADIDLLESPEEVKARLDKIREMGSDIFETRHITREGNVRDMLISARMLNVPGKNLCMSIWTDITERKEAEREHMANLKFFESMDKVNRAIQGADDPEEMMKDVLDEVLSIFDCDRAYLMYPCDPESPTWTCPTERNKPEYPGVLDLKLTLPMDPQVADTLRILLAADGPVTFGQDTPHELPEDVSKQFDIKCFMAMAIYPKTDSPWQFGIHQCSHAREWTDEDKKVFEAIGRRIADSLSTLLSYRDLYESEEKYRLTSENMPVLVYSALPDELSTSIFVSGRARELTGYSNEEFLEDPGLWASIVHPEDKAYVWEKLNAHRHEKTMFEVEYRIITKDGVMKWIKDRAKFVLDENGDTAKIDGFMEDITERKQAEEALRKSEKQLRLLASKLISAQEDERKRISLELHDEMGQALTAVQFNLAEMEKELPSNFTHTAREKLEEMRSIIEQASGQIHELSFDLRPSMLDDLGLVPTLRWHLNRFRKRTNIEAEFEVVDLDERPDADTETVLYRVVQEAVNNVGKHSEAKKVTVRLQRKRDVIAGYIEDDGKGFDVNEVSRKEEPGVGIGLIGMRERVSILGGSLSIDSRKGHGTRISLEVPLN